MLIRLHLHLFLQVQASLYHCRICIFHITNLSEALIAPGIYSEQLVKTVCSGASCSEECVHTAETSQSAIIKHSLEFYSARVQHTLVVQELFIRLALWV